MLIGLCGAAGAGKDTVAGLLEDARGPRIQRIAFADPLYKAVAAITGLTVEKLQDRVVKEAVIPWLGKSPRHLLQTLGTEWGRGMVRQDIWVCIALERARAVLDRGDSVVITDVRFDNEAQAILEAGGEVWKVIRPGWKCLADDAEKHASEAGVDDRFVSRIVVNDGTVDALRNQLETATI